jgi:crossover junction endodeoxyribonuclease RusA
MAARSCIRCGGPSVGLSCTTCLAAPPAPKTAPAKVFRLPAAAVAWWDGETLVVTIPYPPTILNPNGRGHWSQRYRAQQAQKQAAELAVLRTRRAPRWETAETQAVFFVPRARPMDGDNAAATLKGAWDGVAAAGVVTNDRGMIHQPPTFAVDVDRPRVELTIRERTP